MTLKDVKSFALSVGVSPLGTKTEIIKAIQVAEGYQACFGTRPVEECPEISCLWRRDCFRLAREVKTHA